MPMTAFSPSKNSQTNPSSRSVAELLDDLNKNTIREAFWQRRPILRGGGSKTLQDHPIWP